MSAFKIITSGLSSQLDTSVNGQDVYYAMLKNLCLYFDFPMASLYLFNEKRNGFLRVCEYQWVLGDEYPSFFGFNEGAVGRAATEKKQLTFPIQSEEFFYKITSAMGICSSTMFLEFPVIFGNCVKGIVEVLSLKDVREVDLEVFVNVMSYYAVILETLRGRKKVEELSAENKVLLKKNIFLEEYVLSINDNNELQEIKEILNVKNDANIKQDKTKVTVNQNNLGDDTEKDRTNYLASISHELRTPLNSLLLLSQMLLDNEEGNLTNDQMESIGVIYDSGKELLSLINDILDLSKIGSGKMEVNVDKVIVSTICSEIKKIFNPLAENNKLNFEVIVSDSAPKIVMTDHQKLMQILKNFIANALKFTKNGDVLLMIDKCERYINKKLVEYTMFSVKDTGIGISQDKLSMIFDAFCQADGSTSRQYGGTGLGLTIAKKTSQLLNGFIEVESEENVGTVFKLFLPNIKE